MLFNFNSEYFDDVDYKIEILRENSDALMRRYCQANEIFIENIEQELFHQQQN